MSRSATADQPGLTSQAAGQYRPVKVSKGEPHGSPLLFSHTNFLRASTRALTLIVYILC